MLIFIYRKNAYYIIGCCGVTVVRWPIGGNDFRVVSLKPLSVLVRFSQKTFAMSISVVCLRYIKPILCENR